MWKTALGALALSALVTSPALAAERSVRIGVGGLTCPSCPFIVSSALKKVPSVAVGEFSEGPEKESGVFVVTYDDQATTPQALLNAVTDNGYPAKLLPDAGEESGS